MRNRPPSIKRFIIPKIPIDPGKSYKTRLAAFTLIELLLVVSVMVILMGMLTPAFTSIGAGQNFTYSISGIGNILQQARTYAMANNTHVFVGLAEVAAGQSSSISPQVSGTGCVAVVAVASRDGTRIYGSAPSTWNAGYNSGAGLMAVSGVQRFNGLHLADLTMLSPAPDNGNLARPAVPEIDQIGSSQFQSLTPFEWPLGTAINSGQYVFNRVIEFDSEGAACIQTSASTNSVARYLEIGLQQSHGGMVSSGSNVAAIQIGGVSGAVTTYRP